MCVLTHSGQTDYFQSLIVKMFTFPRKNKEKLLFSLLLQEKSNNISKYNANQTVRLYVCVLM